MTDNLTDFVTRNAKPYDPETDDYRRPPFASPIKAAKSTPVYNIHRYHTKVPPQGIEPYIRHYAEPGGIVLDPFCGSGMTGVAAVALGHPVILNDLSPAAAHIAYNYSTPVDALALRNEFDRINKAVKDEFDWLYGTVCDRCSQPATIIYTIWSDVLECGRCGEPINLWDVAVDHKAGTISENLKCPKCEKDQTKKKLKWLRSVPVLTAYECSHCKPSRAEHATTEAEIQRIAEIESRPIPYWFPTIPFDQEWEMWRAVHRTQGVTDISKFYSARNLWAISKLWDECNRGPKELVEKLRFVFTGIAQGLTKRCQYLPGASSFPMPFQTGTLHIPSLTKEYNALIAFKNKLILRVTKLPAPKNAKVIANVGSATNLNISENSIDYIFTDPPFGSNIFYADMNLLWEAWLGEFTDEQYEAVVHLKHKNKNTLPDYGRLMTEAFAEMYRVLKPGRWASVVFHNSDDRIWQTIIDGAEAVGFEIAEVNAFDKVQLSFKGIRGAKGLERVTNKDIVINLLKPRQHEPTRANERIDQAEAEQRVLETVANFLATNPQHSERSLQHIWNHVLFDMIRSGNVQVSMAMLDEMLSYHYKTFKMVDGKYYLRGEAVVGGNVFDLNTDAGAIAWLNSVLGNESQNTGELIPKWQKETAHLNINNPGRLDILLEQNFWQEEKSGNWRLPTPAEREKMSTREDLGAQAHLRVIRRFLQGTFDRRPSDLELAAWIRFCYNREFYPEAFTLFEHVNQAGLEPEEYKTVKKMSSAAKMKK